VSTSTADSIASPRYASAPGAHPCDLRKQRVDATLGGIGQVRFAKLIVEALAIGDDESAVLDVADERRVWTKQVIHLGRRRALCVFFAPRPGTPVENSHGHPFLKIPGMLPRAHLQIGYGW
jgi:hypothetical protein